MKKMKGVVGVNSLPSGVYEDVKTKIKTQNLMQEYQELQKETEAMKAKLQNTKHKKLTLLAEVSFLRRKYKYLIQNQTRNPRSEQHYAQAQPHKSETRNKTLKKGKIYVGKEAGLHYPVQNFGYKQKEMIYNVKEATLRKPGLELGKEAGLRYPVQNFEYKQKEMIYSGKEATLRKPVLELGKEAGLHYPVSNFEYKQKEKIYSGKEATLRKPIPNVELNQKERVYRGKQAAGLRKPSLVSNLNKRDRSENGKEVVARKPVPIFDLNLISGEEEEEFQANIEPMKVEEPKKPLMNGVIDEQQKDMKLLLCRNVGNGSNRAGKRKISWQDQVALRV